MAALVSFSLHSLVHNKREAHCLLLLLLLLFLRSLSLPLFFLSFFSFAILPSFVFVSLSVLSSYSSFPLPYLAVTMGRRGRQQSEGDPTDLEAGGTSRRAGGKLSKAEQRRADAEAAHAASATASSSSELPPGSDALSSDAAGSGTEPPCTHCGSAAHPSRACGARKDRAKATTAKCHLCGRRGHLRKDCPGLDDGGTGQSKYKGKYSKLPAVSAAAAAGAGLAADSSEDEGEAPWWPALSKDVQVADWCTRPARLLASLGQRAALSAFVEARPLRFPAQLGLWLMVFDEPATLLPEGASLEYRFWEQPVYALAETPGAALAFGLAPRYAAAHWASTTADRLREYLAQETAMAVGVTGLDFAAVPVGEPGRADRQAQVQKANGKWEQERPPEI